MRTMLLVEDDALELAAYRRKLEPWFVVLNAATTEEADAQLRDHPEITIIVLTGGNLLKAQYAEHIRSTFQGTLVGTAPLPATQSRMGPAFDFVSSPSTFVNGLIQRFAGDGK